MNHEDRLQLRSDGSSMDHCKSKLYLHRVDHRPPCLVQGRERAMASPSATSAKKTLLPSAHPLIHPSAAPPHPVTVLQPPSLRFKSPTYLPLSLPISLNLLCLLDGQKEAQRHTIPYPRFPNPIIPHVRSSSSSRNQFQIHSHLLCAPLPCRTQYCLSLALFSSPG